MGGNTAAINRNTMQVIAYAEHVDFKTFDRTTFILEFRKLFQKINDWYYKLNHEFLWEVSLIRDSNDLFSGSAKHLFSSDILNEDFVLYKPIVGDIDILVPSDKLQELYHTLTNLEGKSITQKTTYLGQNKPKQMGFQINALFNYMDENRNSVNVQVDFEGSKFVNRQPTEFSTFSHNSDWNDVKCGLKGVAHKYLLQNLVRAKSTNPNMLILTPASTPEKPRIKKMNSIPREFAFSVDIGLRKKYEIMKHNGSDFYLENKVTYKEIPSDKSNYIQSLKEIYSYIFDNSDGSDINNIQSFSGLTKSMKKYWSNDKIIECFHYLLTTSLWGVVGQQLDRTSSETDFNIKKKITEHLIKQFPYLKKIYSDYKPTIIEYYKKYGNVTRQYESK